MSDDDGTERRPSNVRLFPTSKPYTNGADQKIDEASEGPPQRFPRWLILTAYILVGLTVLYTLYGLVQALR